MAAVQLQEAYDYDYAYEPYAPRENKNTVLKEKRLESLNINTALRSRCFTLVIVTALMASIVALGNQLIASRGYELVQAKQAAERLELENEHLKVDIAQLKSPQRIKDIAIRQLGMVVPESVYFVKEKR